MIPTQFINQKDESRYYLNSTFQVQYFNVIFRQVIVNIDDDLILKKLGFDDNNFAYKYQKAIILQELQNIFGNRYKGSQKKIPTDHLFMVINIRVNEQMDASESEGMLYKVLSETSFRYERIYISSDNKKGTTWLISEYMNHLFGMEIVDTFTCLSCDLKSPKVTADDKLILYF